jgi:hypothetical protein
MPQASERHRATLAELKQSLRELQPQVELPLATLSCGWPAVDGLLGGGLPRGRLTEVTGARSSGKTSLALAAAARASMTGQLVAWIDGPGELYPPVAAAEGVDLERLLIVKSGGGPGNDAGLAAARAGEIVARSRAFGLVVLDLPARASFPERAGARLRAAAHETGVVMLALGERRGALPHAHCQLDVAVAHAAADAPALRHFDVTLVRGGLAPGAQVQVAHGAPSLSEFRDAQTHGELLAAADAIRPLPWRSSR